MNKAVIEYHPTIHQLPASERPRERLRDAGASYLSNQELLAIILRVGTQSENAIRLAERLIAEFKGLDGLSQASFVELCEQHGVGEAKAAQIKAALEIGRRLVVTEQARPTVRSPQDVANLLMAEMGLLEQEHFRIVILNVRNHVLDTPVLYRGSVHSSVIRIGEVFREAVRRNGAAIIVVHNHPSGDPTPSPEDVRVTRDLVKAGELLDIEVLDHLVIGRTNYASLKEKGLGFG